ncbi:MAG: hypothetical protein KatS3mg087_1049 [Patescibacteria group bacterium]|nr:MAG: hypothetical protein KatS3mg087_1049 [Patescibacteria group bacterium]
MGFTVVHQPSYGLVGSLAAESERQKYELELARQWAALNLQQQEVDIRRGALALDQQKIAASILENERQRQYDYFKLLASEAAEANRMAMQLQFDLAREANKFGFEEKLFDKKAALERELLGKKLEADAAALDKEAALRRELERMRAEAEERLTRLRSTLFRDETAIKDALATRDSLRGAIAAVKELDLNEKGMGEASRIESEFVKILDSDELTDAQKAVAYNKLLVDISKLYGDEFRKPQPTAQELIDSSIGKVSFVNADGSKVDIPVYIKRHSNGQISDIVPLMPRSGMPESPGMRAYYDPVTQKAFYYDGTRIIEVLPSKGERIQNILKDDNIKTSIMWVNARRQARLEKPEASDTEIDYRAAEIVDQYLHGDIINRIQRGEWIGPMPVGGIGAGAGTPPGTPPTGSGGSGLGAGPGTGPGPGPGPSGTGTLHPLMSLAEQLAMPDPTNQGARVESTLGTILNQYRDFYGNIDPSYTTALADVANIIFGSEPKQAMIFGHPYTPNPPHDTAGVYEADRYFVAALGAYIRGDRNIPPLPFYQPMTPEGVAMVYLGFVPITANNRTLWFGLYNSEITDALAKQAKAGEKQNPNKAVLDSITNLQQRIDNLIGRWRKENPEAAARTVQYLKKTLPNEAKRARIMAESKMFSQEERQYYKAMAILYETLSDKVNAL